MSDEVLMLVREGVAWITINRPASMNAINNAVREGLPRLLDQAQADSAVRVVVVQGAGPKAFCAGADISEFTTVNSLAQDRQRRVHQHWVSGFDRIRKPTIASIHGYCLGGGLEIALSCDIRIGAENALFGFPETGLGILPAAGGTQRASRVLGLGQALDLVLSGERIDAAHALRIGLISRLCSVDALPAQTQALAERLAGKPPLAMEMAKEAVHQGHEMSLTAGLRLEADLQSLLLNTEDRLEAAAAFREKRAPIFTGQ